MAAPVTPDRIPPTTAAYVLATAILAGVTGYFIGQGASLGLFSSTRSPSSSGRQSGGKHSGDEDWENESEDDDDDDEDEEEEEEAAGELATFEGNRDEVKLVLVVRTDLGMGKGRFFPKPSSDGNRYF